MNMIRFVIVDDEPLAVDIFSETLDWEKYGYELAGTASNGQTAMTLIKNTVPDVVFTDIRMPVTDGVELCRQIREFDASIKVIMLTAYRDFEYARKAVSYGASDYLLKNQLEEETLGPLLERLRAEIEKERSQKEALQALYYQNLMLDIPSSHKPWPSDERRQYCYMLLQVPKPFLFICAGIEDRKKITLGMEEVRVLLQNSGSLNAERLLWLGSGSFGLLLFDKEQRSFSFERNREALQELYGNLDDHFVRRYGRHIFVLFDSGEISPEFFKEKWERLMEYSRYAVFLGKPSFEVWQKHLRHFEEPADTENLKKLLGDLDKAFLYGQTNRVRELLGELKQVFSEPEYHPRAFETVCRHAVEMLDGLPVKSGFPQIREETEKMESLIRAEEIWAWLCEKLELASGFRGSGKSAGMDRRMEQALEYIRIHYAEHLTAASVGQQVGLSEIYFSNMFKQEAGVTFGEYLTAYRINAAKYLISCGKYKIYEIAEMTGYGSPQYFSQVFQKRTGYTPMEFKMKEDADKGK